MHCHIRDITPAGLQKPRQGCRWGIAGLAGWPAASPPPFGAETITCRAVRYAEPYRACPYLSERQPASQRANASAERGSVTMVQTVPLLLFRPFSHLMGNLQSGHRDAECNGVVAVAPRGSVRMGGVDDPAPCIWLSILITLCERSTGYQIPGLSAARLEIRRCCFIHVIRTAATFFAFTGGCKASLPASSPGSLHPRLNVAVVSAHRRAEPSPCGVRVSVAV